MRMFISGNRSSWPRSDKIARWAARDGTRWADTVLTRVLARSDAQLAAGDKASRTLRPVDDTAVDTGQSPLAAVIIQLSVSSTPLVSLTPKPRAAVSSSIAADSAGTAGRDIAVDRVAAPPRPPHAPPE